MKRFQSSTNTETDTDPDNSSVQNSVPVVSGKKKRKRSKKNRPTENDEDSDFEPMLDPVNIGSSKHVNVDSHFYNLRSKNPPESEPAVDDEDDDGDEDDIAPNTNNRPKRLQQPPAYINANLTKIKMESDYIPIKQEPRDDNEMNDADVSAGAELNQPQLFINSIPTFGEMTQNSQISQQQQQPEEQEKVVVKEETTSADSVEQVVNGNETEEKEEQELNIIAKLEEKIRKYSERVISLCREKRETQKEVSQLNVVIGQLKNEVQNLNSSSTLLENENENLKSQVAEQEREIEKLKNKLKSRAENKPPAENSDSTVEPYQNPVVDLPTKVLSRIFNYLDLKSVKQSRLVSRLWREEAGKVLLQNFYLVCDEKQRCEKSLKNWINNSNSNSNLASKSVALKLWSRGKNAQGTLQLLTKMPEIHCSVKELKFFNVQSDTQSLYEIVQLLPNLQVLATKTLDLSPGQKWLMLENYESLNNRNGTPVKLERLIKKLETMKKLKLDFAMTKATSAHFFHHREQLASVKSMEIHAAGMHFVNNLLCQNVNVKITHFTLDLHENFDMSLIRSFLIRISPSLQHLKFIVYKDAFRSSSVMNLNLNVEPWKDDWMIPVGWTRIKTVEIVLRPQEISASLQKFMLKSIMISLSLPRLKKLAVGFIPVELQEAVDNWNSFESAGGRTLASESLEELEIFPHFSQFPKSSLVSHQSQSQTKIPRNPWPRLKSLKYSWNSPESVDASFLSELENLEQLELSILIWNPHKNDKNDRNMHPMLRDLKNLKTFVLQMPGNNQSCQDFANSLVQEELKFMKSLQYIQFHRVAVDAAPLKSALGSHVAIIFTK